MRKTKCLRQGLIASWAIPRAMKKPAQITRAGLASLINYPFLAFGRLSLEFPLVRPHGRAVRVSLDTLLTLA